MDGSFKLSFRFSANSQKLVLILSCIILSTIMKKYDFPLTLGVREIVGTQAIH